MKKNSILHILIFLIFFLSSCGVMDPNEISTYQSQDQSLNESEISSSESSYCSEETSLHESSEEFPSDVSEEISKDQNFESSASEISQEVSEDDSSEEIHTEHIFSSWETVAEPTCTATGIKEQKCNGCQAFIQEEIPMLPHTEEILPYIPASCTQEGLTEGKRCSACGKILVKQEKLDLIEHTFSLSKTFPATCTEEGYTLYECICGESKKEEIIPKTSHAYTETVIAPSCEKEGYTLHKCSTCKDTYKDTYTEKIPHQYFKSIILPTLLDKGYTNYACEKCSYTYTDEYTTYDSICKDAYSGSKTVLAKGIDVSKWNHKKDADGNYIPLDWESIKKSGVDFVILKAGSSVGIDPVFEMNYQDARKAGLQIGAYYYSYALTPEESTKEALEFISFIKGKTFEYPLYMDFEDSSQKAISASTKTKMIENFVVTLQRAGYYAGLYTGYYWMNPRFNILESEIIVDMLDIWFAHIDSSESVNIDTEFTWANEDHLNHSEFGMWQYAHKGVFEFIENEFFDLNYAYKDYPTIIKNLGLNGYKSNQKEYVWVKVKNLNVRSYWDISTSSNILAVAHLGDRFEILEKTSTYVKINFNGKEAYISADPSHVSFIPI